MNELELIHMKLNTNESTRFLIQRWLKHNITDVDGDLVL